MNRICNSPNCQTVIPPQKGRSRPRKYCESCRPSRGAKTTDTVVSLPPALQPDRPTLVQTYRRRLEEANRLDTPEGAHVLMLAEMLAEGGHSAAGAASLSRELRSAMEDALKGAPVAADALDELAKRREQKASGA